MVTHPLAEEAIHFRKATASTHLDQVRKFEKTQRKTSQFDPGWASDITCNAVEPWWQTGWGGKCQSCGFPRGSFVLVTTRARGSSSWSKLIRLSFKKSVETRVCWSWREIDLGLQFVEHFLDCLFFLGVREPHLSHWAKTETVRILTCKNSNLYASKSNFNTELSLSWIVPSLNCCFAERTVPWLKFSVAE